MSWWTEARTEPKRKSRFLVEIASGFFLPNVKTCTKPSATVDIKEFQLINHKFKYPGIVTWGDIKVTMIDMRGGGGSTLDTGLLLWKMLKHTGYNFPTEAEGKIASLGSYKSELTTPEKASSIANGFGGGILGPRDQSPAGVISKTTNNQSMKIYSLGPDGSVVEKWTLHNPQIKSINWGDHAYDSDEFVEYSLDIVYDWAKHEPFNGDLNDAVSVGDRYEKFYNAAIYGSSGGNLSDFSLSDLETDADRAEAARAENEQFVIDNQDPGERFLAETGPQNREVVFVDGVPTYRNTIASDSFAPADRAADRAANEKYRNTLRDSRIETKRFKD